MSGPKLTKAQALLLLQLRHLCKRLGYQAMPEYRFHRARRWRIDVALIGQVERLVSGTVHVDPDMIAIEIDGGAYRFGRHNRPTGFVADMEKHNALTELGWRLLRFTPQQVEDGTALATIRRCVEGAGEGAA